MATGGYFITTNNTDQVMGQAGQQLYSSAPQWGHRWVANYGSGIVINSEENDSPYTRYKKLKLKEYSTPEFSSIKDILPKDMVPHAVMCPKEDIKNRIEAYLTN